MKDSAVFKNNFMLFMLLLATLLTCISGCTGLGGYLKSSSLSSDDYFKQHNDNKPLNALRFSTSGPNPQKLYGYFLYKDQIALRKIACHFEDTEKISMQQALADYDRVTGAIMDTTFVKPGRPVIKAFYLNDSVVGYSVSDLSLGITVWDVTPSAAKSQITLDVGCADQRGATGGPGSGVLYSR